MTDPADTSERRSTEVAAAPRLPEGNLNIDFGRPALGSIEPMPDDRRRYYETRIRDSIEAQAAGAEKALHLFIR